MPSSRSFYYELWLVNIVFFCIVLGALISFLSVLAVTYLAYHEAKFWIGGVIIAALIFIPFGLATFILVKGTFQLFLNRWRYLQKYSVHTGDIRTSSKIEYNYIVSQFGQSLSAVRIFEPQKNEKPFTRLVKSQSGGGWLSRFSSHDHPLGTIYWRGEEPYLATVSGVRIWLWPLDDRDKPDSNVGRVLQDFDDSWKT